MLEMQMKWRETFRDVRVYLSLSDGADWYAKFIDPGCN